ncbi:MAG: hydrogenase maturation protease [Acidimicrobiales bacterium]|jgi:hydrogenase maturation protease
MTSRIVVAGIGNEYRRDDGVGPLVAARAVEEIGTARNVGPLVDPLDLLGHWDGADLAVVIDAVHSGTAPGNICVVDLEPAGAERDASDRRAGATSTHGIGLPGVWRLARAIDRAPSRVVIVGIEGEDFGSGSGLSPAVERAVPRAVHQVVDLIREVRVCV